LKEGLKAEYICYPPLFRILSEVEKAKNEAKEDYILFSLGSRKTEVLHHLEFAKEVVSQIKAELPDIRFVFPSFTELKVEIENSFPNEIICCDENEKLYYTKKAKFAICKSGTGAVETAFLGVPSLVFYKANPLSYFIIKMMAKIKFVNLINILLEREVIPEFIQGNATPQNVSKKALEIMQKKEISQAQLNEIAKAKKILLESPYKNFGEGVASKIIDNL
jgi:lipid-A-disaccharide synthase